MILPLVMRFYFLLQKKIESNERKLKKATEELENLKQGNFKKDLSLQKLLQLNREQEEKIKNLLSSIVVKVRK